MSITYTENEVEAAMCLWEECLLRQMNNDDELYNWLRGGELRCGEGAASARLQCILLAKDAEYSWRIAHEHFGFDDSFDWEFVPLWLDHAMDLTETHFITPQWCHYLAYKATEQWRNRNG